MAITKNSLTLSGAAWAVNATSADASGCEELVAAPATTGQSLYLTSISINCATAITVTVGAGETASDVTTVLVGPVTFTAEGGQYRLVFPEPVKITAETSLTVKGSGAGAVQVYADGFTR